jgi:hypothetical protein
VGETVWFGERESEEVLVDPVDLALGQRHHLQELHPTGQGLGASR